MGLHGCVVEEEARSPVRREICPLYEYFSNKMSPPGTEKMRRMEEEEKAEAKTTRKNQTNDYTLCVTCVQVWNKGDLPLPHSKSWWDSKMGHLFFHLMSP